PGVASLLREAGALLARLHEVETTGYGPLDVLGCGPCATWDGFLLAPIDGERGRAALARIQAALDETARAAIEAAADHLREHVPFLRSRGSRLLHHDYEPWHLLVYEGRIS